MMDRENKQVEVRTKSGEKFATEHGFNAIKDGIKQSKAVEADIDRKPPWLRVKLGTGPRYKEVKNLVTTHRLSTVCEESHCPNIGECWNHGTATLMLMGSTCTRACRFCSVDTGNPNGWLDTFEPQSTAITVKKMGLKYVVLTSVDRDDLADGGAQHYVNCIKSIREACPETRIEALTPDFSGSTDAIKLLAHSGITVFAQNLETVRRLTSEVRDPRAGYQQTLSVLRYAKRSKASLLTKSSLMLGLGESASEVQEALHDLREHRVDIVTLGQYMRPTKNHLPVKEWVAPEEFSELRKFGLSLGFLEVAAGPLVRSSYRADKVFERDNLGLSRIPIKQIS
tara:strand:+ start:837 stop:1856 length:1020 start_codon:yes stop_codon:yes gene_type:complete